MDRTFRNAVKLCQSELADYSRVVKRANMDDLGSCEFVKPIQFPWEICSSSFRISIPVIIPASSKPKMVWSHAWWNIAVVQNAQSSWDRTMMDYPTRHMRENHAISVRPNPSISTRQMSSPEPTLIRNAHLAPKPLDKGGRKTLRSEEVGFIEGPLDQFHNGYRVGSRRVQDARGHLMKERLTCRLSVVQKAHLA
jgi:hypothetical protein